MQATVKVYGLFVFNPNRNTKDDSQIKQRQIYLQDQKFNSTKTNHISTSRFNIKITTTSNPNDIKSNQIKSNEQTKSSKQTETKSNQPTSKSKPKQYKYQNFKKGGAGPK